MSKKRYDKIFQKVTLEKTGTHVKVTEGPYTKRELRELLLSSLSLLSVVAAASSGDREGELIRLSGIDPEDLRRLKNGETFVGTDGGEILDDPVKKSAALRLVNLINNENDNLIKNQKRNDALNLLRAKGISDDLINRITSYGLNDETMRLLRALGLTDDEIAELIGMLEPSIGEEAVQDVKSEESCLSVDGSSSGEYMSVEGFYLVSNFRNPLTKALGDIVSKKPWNPTEYLGHWLLNYKICEERAQKQKEFNEELQTERDKLRFEANVEPNVSEVDDYEKEEEEELDEDWNFIEYETD